ncbi:glycosyltransferase family 2 protein [Solobacterium sp.]|uniref:glycosyltransferase family 2 protein n=1 Tax=Solobacterium sp. TaxID=2060878 RepID=UPI001CAB9982|nr:glycosyltransferase family 2 protein [Solobacterium sp.]MBF1099252.1 glycosyltransferase family 2 protein [Solobacterium sp.]
MKYRFESIMKKNDSIKISGFIVGHQPTDVAIFKYFVGNREEHIEYTTVVRNDVSNKYFQKTYKNSYGFSIILPLKKQAKLQVTVGNETHTFHINQIFFGWQSFIIKLRNSKFVVKLKEFIRNLYQRKVTYKSWFKLTKASKEELIKQKEYKWAEDAPLFSIVVPLYRTPKGYLKELIESIEAQTYVKWELCLADGSPDNKLEMLVKSYQDERIKYRYIGENLGISGNTNKAVEMATGDFIVLCDHDDLITPDALFEFTKEIVADKEVDSIYSDEDKIDEKSYDVFDPSFKPDFNIDMLRSQNYICHLYGVRRELVEKYGMFNSEYDGAQDYDFILRMSEHSRKIAHVAKILYHWRTHQGSTALNPESKMYAYDAGARAIGAHYARVLPEIQIERIENGYTLGMYHTVFKFNEYPLISVIIPNKDHTDDLDKAIRSLIEKGTWPNLEFIVVENNSTEEKTWEYYKKIEKEYSQVKVVYYDGIFNYAKINNFGVRHARGEYYLFMNNDVELIEPDSLKEMMGYGQRNDVGAVGCRLLYEDNTLQHAGVIVGEIGVAEHIFKKQIEGMTYHARAMLTQDMSAVTAAVMLVKKEVFEKVEGFDERFAVAFNDIDICMKIREDKKLIVYAPYACFHHYESKSRGAEDTPEKIERFINEVNLFNSKWRSFIENGDPYYNCNFSKKHTDCRLR